MFYFRREGCDKARHLLEEDAEAVSDAC